MKPHASAGLLIVIVTLTIPIVVLYLICMNDQVSERKGVRDYCSLPRLNHHAVIDGCSRLKVDSSMSMTNIARNSLLITVIVEASYT